MESSILLELFSLVWGFVLRVFFHYFGQSFFFAQVIGVRIRLTFTVDSRFIDFIGIIFLDFLFIENLNFLSGKLFINLSFWKIGKPRTHRPRIFFNFLFHYFSVSLFNIQSILEYYVTYTT
jgi:hypothetical protein